ncbi:MAG: HAD-IC family P-type ATPase, partial [Pseudomonadota bacterium]
LAAALERGSEHPLARAILDAASARGLGATGDAAGFTAIPGRGVEGAIDGETTLLGTEHLMAERGVALTPQAARAGESVAFLAQGGALAARFVFADQLKADAAASLAALQGEGLRVILASGDAAGPVEAVAAETGVAEAHARRSPEDKAALVTRLQAAGARVIMAGDGINDAPALAAADVGVAMGDGADIAIESAGVTLLKGDLTALVRARRLATATRRNIAQNLGFAFLYNGLGVPIAAGALYPLFGLLLSPVLAAAAMSLSSVSVIWNALRLRRTPL